VSKNDVYKKYFTLIVQTQKHTLYRYLTFGNLDFIAPRSHPAVERADAESSSISPNSTLHEAVERTEKRVILETLERHRWHKTRSAATLGIPRSTLRRKMKKYEL
jgi:DNA-binding NtrC family response regulator